MSAPEKAAEEMRTDRLGAFTDGVVAIIITIMVLELRVPEAPTWAAFRHTLPLLAAYLLSFVNVGIYWMNHHHLLHLAKRVNGNVLLANLFLLFWLSLVPFVIRWVGEAEDITAVTDFEVLCYYVNSPLFDAGQLPAFNAELSRISTSIGKPVSCAKPVAVVLNVKTTNAGWNGLPAQILLDDLAATTVAAFQVSGDPLNTCGSGERGGPIFSSTVDRTASFFSVATVQNLPTNIGGPGVNRRPCSSFVATKSYAAGLPNQVWINATGRGQQFGGPVALDWEIQVRYSNGDPRGPTPGLGATCQVGVVPNSGNYAKSFDSICTHQVGGSIIQQ